MSHLFSDNSILTKSKIMTHSTDDVIVWDDARFYDSFSSSWLVFQNCLRNNFREFFTIWGLSIDKNKWNLTLKSLIVLMWYFLFICRAVDVTHFVHHNVASNLCIQQIWFAPFLEQIAFIQNLISRLRKHCQSGDPLILKPESRTPPNCSSFPD